MAPTINFIFQRSSDNIAPDATLSVNTGVEDTDFPKENIVNLLPAKPMKFTGTIGSVVFDFGSAQRIDLVALFNHNLDAGLDVRIQGNATNTWGAPTFDATFTIVAATTDGIRVNPWLDLVEEGGYSAGGFQFWRVAVIGTNSVAVALGEVWLSALARRLIPNVRWGAIQRDQRRLIRHVLPSSLVATFDLGSRWREFDAQVVRNEVARQEIIDWWRDTRGAARPFLLVPDGLVNDAWFARFVEQNLDFTLRHTNQRAVTLRFEEVPSGLPL